MHIYKKRLVLPLYEKLTKYEIDLIVKNLQNIH